MLTTGKMLPKETIGFSTTARVCKSVPSPAIFCGSDRLAKEQGMETNYRSEYRILVQHIETGDAEHDRML